MRTEYFMEQVYVPELRQHIVDTAKAFTRSIELQEDLAQEAYLALAEAEAGKSARWYQAVAYRAMDNYRKREGGRFRKDQRIREIMRGRVLAGKPVYGRQGRPVKRKFIKKTREN